ncbi:MAG: hypothetical protein CTY33_09140 [Methylotenera sp.]|nr:MAG: hypothetical protein CTY33_09140 [Methylotenera sp.]
MRQLCYGFLLSIFSITGYTCNDVDALYATESAKLLENAPAFKHGWEDKTIQLSFSDIKSTSSGCVATLQLTLPQPDLDEVNTDLNANPAKRILLAAQGYEIPQQTVNRVEYHYQIVDGKVSPLTASNHALTSLYNNVEYLYQSLSQLRIALKKGIKNTIPWDNNLKQKELEDCKKTYAVAVGDLAFACTCRVDNLSRILSPRQIELVHFIESQPYSVASGALNTYAHTSKEINEDCSNLTKKSP